MAEPERILVVKLADLGDLLTATPALRALRLRFPQARISALVTPHTAPLLEGNDAVDRIIVFPKALYNQPGALLLPARGPRALVHGLRLWRLLRSEPWDAVVLLHHLTTGWGAAKYRMLALTTGAPCRVGLDNGAGSFLTHRAVDRGFGGRHEVDYWLDVVALLGAEHPNPRLEVPVAPEEDTRAAQRWSALGLEGREVVALHPGSGAFSVARRWAPEGYAAVGDALAQDGSDVLIIAGLGEEELAERVRTQMSHRAAVLEPGPNPRELAAVLRRCRLFVGNDSGVMHLAATMEVPVVGVFGLTNHRAWGPYPPEQHRVIRLDLPCSPCFYTGFGLGTPEGCPPRTCLTTLGPEAVVATARELLASRR